MQLTTARTESIAPTPKELGADLFALVVHVHKMCMADLFEALGALELTVTQTKLLHHLEDPAVELTVKELAELVKLSLPAASRTIDDLVRRSFVERREDPDDRRQKRVRATDEGRAVVRRLNAARLNGLEEFAASLTDEERLAAATALSVLLRRSDIAANRPEGTDA
jgi:DNA-binding MarR family transcriptional regulator